MYLPTTRCLKRVPSYTLATTTNNTQSTLQVSLFRLRSGGCGWSKLADANFGGNWIKSYQFPPISANPGGGLRVSGENWLEIGRVEAPNSGGTTVYELYQGPFWGKLAKIGGLAPRRVSGGNWIKLRRIGRSLSNFHQNPVATNFHQFRWSLGVRYDPLSGVRCRS